MRGSGDEFPATKIRPCQIISLRSRPRSARGAEVESSWRTGVRDGTRVRDDGVNCFLMTLWGWGCIPYLSVAVWKPQGQGNLEQKEFTWVYSSRRLGSIVAGSMAARARSWELTVSFVMAKQIDKLEVGWLHTLKTCARDRLPSVRPYLLELPQIALPSANAGGQVFKSLGLWGTVPKLPLGSCQIDLK